MCEWTVPVSPNGRARHKRRGEQPCRECSDANSAYSREMYRAGGAAAQRWVWIWRGYRLRRHEYEAIIARQGGVCAICGEPFKNSKTTHIDHKHGCDHPGKGTECCAGCVRGILCAGCNTGIAILDDLERLKKALAYLARDDVTELIQQQRLW
jgi:hypothetical protein